jgi:hypothetical protein
MATMRPLVCLLVMVMGGAAHADAKKYPWQKPPGPIAGQWKVTCKDMAGLIVEFSVSGDKASGKIATLGAGGVRNYKEGEEIITLTSDDLGEWSGKLVWRAVTGAHHVDHIRFRVNDKTADAYQSTDDCFKAMPRVR